MDPNKQRHRTTAEHARVAGWVDFSDGWEVTVMPPVDVRYGVDGWPVYARPTYDDALAICKRYDAELLDDDDVDKLRDMALVLVPYLGTDIAEVTLEHSKRHDADMARQLREAGWDGKVPIFNCLKLWVAGAKPGRSRLKGWYLDPSFVDEVLRQFGGIPDQGQGGKLPTVEPGEYIQPAMDAHNRLHHDDGTGIMMKRRKGAKGPGDELPDVTLDFNVAVGAPGVKLDINRNAYPEPSSRGDNGDNVFAFQVYLQAYFKKLGLPDPLPKYGPDRDHGHETEMAKKRWLEIEGLGEVPDDWPEPQAPPADETPLTQPGVVLPSGVPWKLWDPKLGRVPDGRIQFKQARYYHPGRMRKLRLLVLHTPEMSEDLVGVDTNAEGLMNYAHNMPDGRTASWNYASDRDSVTQSVRLKDTAFHGGKGANAHTAGVEVSMGFAKQTPAEWDDAYSREAMEIAAELFAILCREVDIPPVRPHFSTIRDESVRGIIGHVDLRDAGYPTSHYDPGPNFPWERWLGRVRYYYDALEPWFGKGAA